MDSKSWNEILNSLPGAHLLQSAQWAEVKEHFGWKPFYLIWHVQSADLELTVNTTGDFQVENPAAAALVLERKLLRGLSVLYLPKGPILQDWSDTRLRKKVLEDLKDFARTAGAIQIKIDPDIVVGTGVPGEKDAEADPQGEVVQRELTGLGWRFSPDQIQFRNTFLINLIPEEEEILGSMKSKTRYNIRLASRKGISIRRGDTNDLADLYQMYADTSLRGEFTIRGKSYYDTLWRVFTSESLDLDRDASAQPIVAEFEGNPVAGAVMFRFCNRAWYLHGMSLPEHSDKMATYLVQWEGMLWAKENGCSTYDMWGAPDQFNESDSMWGVYRFKRGFGGVVTRTIGAWDYPVKTFVYMLYTNLLPRVLNAMRFIGNRKTRRIAEEN
ncbi:MAG: peptidoglycan bridge formation glycyltransferase FemA/FemB family protein [Anaerolineales bacterium]